ncbi:MAG: hypothetical protein ACKVJ1_10240, partial [Verrucomicrobiia bacterium]
RNALFASNAKKVVANDNQVNTFLGTAIIIRNSDEPTVASNNIAFSNEPLSLAIKIIGPQGKVKGNVVQKKPSQPELP